jgi:hypothetical protein
MTIVSLAVMCAIAVSAQSARGLYVGYKPKSAKVVKTPKKTPRVSSRVGKKPRKVPAPPPAETAAVPATGLPGTKVTIELMRNGESSDVDSNYRFRSGDRIRLRLQTNFEGYVSLVNVGSSGKVQTLYPGDGIPRLVYPSRDFLVPESGAWILFDDTPGVELLTVVMSNKPLGRSPDGYGEIRKANSRDLTLEYTGDSVYAVYPEEGISSAVGFTMKLIHGR